MMVFCGLTKHHVDIVIIIPICATMSSNFPIQFKPNVILDNVYPMLAVLENYDQPNVQLLTDYNFLFFYFCE